MKQSLLACVAILLCASLTAPALAQTTPVVEYSGICDASAAVSISSNLFIVANDEDNVLRVYSRNQPGPSIMSFDLNAYLKPDAEDREADIEGATRIGDRVYWITSHGRNKNGKLRPSRHRLFATDVHVHGDKVTITPCGTPYQNLIKDLIAVPALKQFNLEVATSLAPEAPGALNIEGLSATPQGALLIGVRNPIPDGKALVVPLENPKDVINGQAAKFGAPLQLPLGGLGIRSIEYVAARSSYLIVAGAPDDAHTFNLYEWWGDIITAPEMLGQPDLTDLRPEALIVYPLEQAGVQLLSDDGVRQVDGQDCKDAPPELRKFQSFWLNL